MGFAKDIQNPNLPDYVVYKQKKLGELMADMEKVVFSLQAHFCDSKMSTKYRDWSVIEIVTK